MSEVRAQIGIGEMGKAVLNIIPNLPTVLQGLYYAKYLGEKTPAGLAYVFNKAVKKNPGGCAILYENQKYTYKELDEWSNKIANLFLSKGLKNGDTIAVFMENRPEYLATLLGGAKIGIGMALINTSQKGKVLLHSLNLLKPKLIIVGNELLEPFNEIKDEIETPASEFYWMPEQKDDHKTKDGLTNISLEIENASAKNVEEYWKKIAKKTPLFYIYTSGTTGLPKASKFNNGRFMRAYGLFGCVTMRYDKSDVVYVPLPLYHATGLAVAWGAILQGAASIAIDRKFSASRFWSKVKAFQATSFAYVGELCNYLIAQPECEEEKNNTIKSIIGNGMRLNTWGKFKDRFEIDKIGEFYASSEGNVGFSNLFNLDHTCGYGGVPYEIVKFDKEKDEPIRNSKGKLIPVKKGETGLLIGKITNASPFDGYTEQEKTNKVILRDCLKKGDAYFNTGDLVRNQGFKHIQFIDRTGDTYRWKGENVSTTEMENIITDFPGMGEVVVYGVEIPGSNGKAGMANIISQTGDSEIDYKAFLEYLKKNVPKYSIPLFLRLSKAVDTTGTFKYTKAKLKDEAFFLDKVGEDKIWVLLPQADSYTPLTKDILKQIVDKEISF